MTKYVPASQLFCQRARLPWFAIFGQFKAVAPERVQPLDFYHRFNFISSFLIMPHLRISSENSSERGRRQHKVQQDDFKQHAALPRHGRPRCQTVPPNRKFPFLRRKRHFSSEKCRGKGAEDGGRQRRRNQNGRRFQDIAHLQHRGAQALGNQAGYAVFTIAGHGKAHHLRTTAHRGRACGQVGVPNPSDRPQAP